MRSPSFMKIIVACLIAAMGAACTAEAPPPPPQARVTTSGDSADFGAVSADVPPPPKRRVDIAKTTEWPEATLESGVASISCSTDYLADGDGTTFSDLGFFSVLDTMLPCKDSKVVRLHYRGRVAGDFTTLIERVANMSMRMGIERRILDIDSSGGQVEDAIRAGDAMAESGWIIWVREGAVCHSACVLLLAGGDDRVIGGAVGIHRIIRIKSNASTRAELNEELRDVHDAMKAYLERNGAGVVISDFMMTVPNRSLRLLTQEELATYGLAGRNAAQEDLERIKLVRRCGVEFMRRQDAFHRAFDRRCATLAEGVDAINTCGLALRGEFGFPDKKCPDDSPLAELDPPHVPESTKAGEDIVQARDVTRAAAASARARKANKSRE